MEAEVLERINAVIEWNEEAIRDTRIEFKGAEIVFLAQYIERLEEKEQILNALLNKQNVINMVNNNN